MNGEEESGSEGVSGSGGSFDETSREIEAGLGGDLTRAF